jgi:hypothetical protein
MTGDGQAPKAKTVCLPKVLVHINYLHEVKHEEPTWQNKFNLKSFT